MNVNSNTPLIKVDTGEYPLYLSAVLSKNKNVMFPLEPSEELLAEFGYAVVDQIQKPAGDVVVEVPPTIINGRYTQTWNVRSFTQAELDQQLLDLKQRLRSDVDQIRDADLASGLTYVFPDGAVGNIQIRVQDQLNLLLLRTEANGYVAAQDTTTLQEVRVLENINYYVPATIVVDMTDKALALGRQIYKASWKIKDQINAAQTAADLPTIPDTLKTYVL